VKSNLAESAPGPRQEPSEPIVQWWSGQRSRSPATVAPRRWAPMCGQ
jgi:hypothetical protein